MMGSFWRPLLVDGGLSIDTRKDGPDSPIVLRTILHLDAAITLVDPSASDMNQDLLARHNAAVLRAATPLSRILNRLNQAAAGMGIAALLVYWRIFSDAPLRHRLIGEAVIATFAIVARWALPKLFFRILRWWLGRFFAEPSPGVQPGEGAR